MAKQPRIAFASLEGFSRTSVDRAGDHLRRYWLSDDTEASDQVIEAYRCLIQFRETFQDPLRKTATGLRSMVKSERPELRASGMRIPVVQRLKRRAQIINKLARFPESKLSNMGDAHDAINLVTVGDVRDTRDDSAPSGYRALHAIVLRDGRRIEIQLRDPREHDWALAVERTGARLRIPLKEGEGPADLKEYFRLASLGMYRDSLGIEHDPGFEGQFEAARETVRHYFRR